MAEVKDQPPVPEQGEDAAPLSDQPPKYILPGDNSELDALVAKLREDSEDGDPLWRPKSWTEKMRAAGLHVGPLVDEAKAPADKGSEPASLGALAVDRRLAGKRISTRWVLLAIVAMVMPVLALLLGVVLKYQQRSIPEVTPAQATTTHAPAAPAASVQGTAPHAPTTHAPASQKAPAPPMTTSQPPSAASPMNAEKRVPAPPAAGTAPRPAPSARTAPAPEPPLAPKPETNPSDDPGLVE